MEEDNKVAEERGKKVGKETEDEEDEAEDEQEETEQEKEEKEQETEKVETVKVERRESAFCDIFVLYT